MRRRRRPVPEPEPDIDWALCDRIAAVWPDDLSCELDLDHLLELTADEQDVVLGALASGTMASFDEAMFELRYWQLARWRRGATVEQRHRALHSLWNACERPHRQRLQIELGIGSPWPHGDFIGVDNARRLVPG